MSEVGRTVFPAVARSKGSGGGDVAGSVCGPRRTMLIPAFRSGQIVGHRRPATDVGASGGNGDRCPPGGCVTRERGPVIGCAGTGSWGPWPGMGAEGVGSRLDPTLPRAQRTERRAPKKMGSSAMSRRLP